MTNFAKATLSAAIALSVLAAPLGAQEIVVSPSSEAAFVAKVEADLDRQIQRMRFHGLQEPTGATSVRFRVGEDGSPVEVSTYRRSGSIPLDRQARRAVSRLTSLSALPSTASPGQVIQANIIMARSERQLEQLANKVAKDEARRIASSPAERAVLALTITPAPVS